MAIAKFYPINSPLVNYFFYNAPLPQSGANIPLALGKIYFYADEDHSVELPTYSDISDPNNPVINTNPVVLGAAGEMPLFYLEDRLYYIEIRDSLNALVRTISHYNPSSNTGIFSGINYNFIDNGQFTYPIKFWEDDKEVGEITAATTRVAWGWDFRQDGVTTTKNYITFEDVSQEGIEGSPEKELVLTSTSIDAAEQTKDLVSVIGAVNLLAGQKMTFSAMLQNKNAGTVTGQLLLECNYGKDGSDTQQILLETFTITEEREKQYFIFDVPSIDSKTIGEGNYLAPILRIGVGQTCKVGITNVLDLPGSITEPVYVEESGGDERAQILGSSTSIEIDNASVDKNYSPYFYKDGLIAPLPDTGAILLIPNDVSQNYRVPCDGATYKVSGSTKSIPNKRLYSRIGNLFGEAGDIIATSSSNVITVSSGKGAREKNPFTAGTTSFNVVQSAIGLSMGIDAEVYSATQILFTWVEKFAVANNTPSVFGVECYPGIMGGGLNYLNVPIVFAFSVLNPGDVSNNAQVVVDFLSQNINDYKVKQRILAPALSSPFLDFAADSSLNTRQPAVNTLNRVIGFSVNGQADGYGFFTEKTIHVPLWTGYNLEDNLKYIVVPTIANPFVYKITVSAKPTESQYFLYSSKDTDYYAWYKVDGVGTDPAVAGRTGVEVNINSSDSLEVIAQKTAAEMDTLTFSVPDVSDLPDLQLDSKVSWFINL